MTVWNNRGYSSSEIDNEPRQTVRVSPAPQAPVSDETPRAQSIWRNADGSPAVVERGLPAVFHSLGATADESPGKFDRSSAFVSRDLSVLSPQNQIPRTAQEVPEPPSASSIWRNADGSPAVVERGLPAVFHGLGRTDDEPPGKIDRSSAFISGDLSVPSRLFSLAPLMSNPSLAPETRPLNRAKTRSSRLWVGEPSHELPLSIDASPALPATSSRRSFPLFSLEPDNGSSPSSLPGANLRAESPYYLSGEIELIPPPQRSFEQTAVFDDGRKFSVDSNLQYLRYLTKEECVSSPGSVVRYDDEFGLAQLDWFAPSTGPDIFVPGIEDTSRFFVEGCPGMGCDSLKGLSGV